MKKSLLQTLVDRVQYRREEVSVIMKVADADCIPGCTLKQGDICEVTYHMSNGHVTDVHAWKLTPRRLLSN